ncbi:MAG: efflux RND transporter periplasmic adaptor subunit [Thiotrichales bacterium]
MRASLLILALFAPAPTLLAADYPATIDWADVARLGTPLSGRVASVSVEVGARVKQGAVLATLDRRGYEAELKRAEAELKRLQATFAETEREYNRARELFERTVLSTTELQQAETAFNAGQASLHAADANVTLARLNLEYSQVRAPFDGVVIERNVHPGETVANQLQVSPLLRVASVTRWVARAWVDPATGAGLRPGTEVAVTVLGQRLTGTLRGIGLASRTDASGATGIALDITFRAGDALTLAPGLPAMVTLP